MRRKGKMPKPSKIRRAIYLYEDKCSPQYSYRVLNPSEACKKSKKWHIDAFSKKEINELRNLIKEAKLFGLKVVFDLDDLVFDYKFLHLVAQTTNEKNYLYWAGYIWGIRRIAKKADAFLATNDFLAQKIKESFNKPVATIPNSLSSEQVGVSQGLCKSKHARSGFLLGYFSGSPTHTKDFRLVESSIIQFLKSTLMPS